MADKNNVPEVGFNGSAPDGKPFFCPHCKTPFTYEEIVSEEKAERVNRVEMIYRCRKCSQLFRLLN